MPIRHKSKSIYAVLAYQFPHRGRPWNDGNPMSSKKDTPPLCKALRKVTKKKGVNQTELAERTGIKQPTLSRYFVSRVPDPDTVLKIERALDLRPGDIGRLAGYVEDAKSFEELLAKNVRITDEAKQSLNRVYEAAVEFFESQGLEETSDSSIKSRSSRLDNSERKS